MVCFLTGCATNGIKRSNIKQVRFNPVTMPLAAEPQPYITETTHKLNSSELQLLDASVPIIDFAESKIIQQHSKRITSWCQVIDRPINNKYRAVDTMITLEFLGQWEEWIPISGHPRRFNAYQLIESMRIKVQTRP